MKAWLKGGVIALVLYVVAGIIEVLIEPMNLAFTHLNLGISPVRLIVIYPLLTFVSRTALFEFWTSPIGLVISVIVNILVIFLIGAIIGYIVGKIRQRSK
jgi:hypothetical protein